MLELKEERIDEDKHFSILGDFVCGADDPLNLFLSDDAIRYDRDSLGNTYLVMSEGDIVAFYTLKANGIQVEEDDGECESYPMIEISRIAVAFDLQGGGIGKRIFYDHILPKVELVSRYIAVRGIMVFAEKNNIQGIGFYKSLGFIRADDSVQKNIQDSFNIGCDLYTVSLKNLR